MRAELGDVLADRAASINSSFLQNDRYLLILKFLHFNNNDDPGFDPNDENRDR